MVQEVQLQTFTDIRGNLTVAEKLAFPIKRVYWLHGVTAPRGGHAHKEVDRIFVAVNGSFRLTCRGKSQAWFDHTLNDPTKGVRVSPLEWCEVSEFLPGTVCLILASREHDEADCIRDFAEFLRRVRT